ncbi:MAG: SHOCT domain-containing protein [bacterium]
MRTILVTGLFTILSIPIPVSLALAQAREWGGGPWGWHYMWGAMGIGMMLFMFVFWILIIVGVIALVRLLWGQRREPHGMFGSSETAEDILKKRYSRGEIDKEEFEAKLQDLRAS